MSIKHFIKNYLLEQDENIVQVTPEEYIELLDDVGGIASRIPMLKQFKGKKIIITGPIDLSKFKTIGPLTGVERVIGRLDVSNTNVSNLNGIQVDGYVSDYGSTMWKTKRQKELNKKLTDLSEKRRNNEWDVNNQDDDSERTEALYDYLEIKNEIDTVEYDDGNEGPEDKYYIYPSGKGMFGYGKQYEWLGGGNGFSPITYDVYDSNELDYAAKRAVESNIDELGYDAFVDWVWDDALDNDQWNRWLQDFYYDVVNDDLDNYEIPLTLSSEQQKRVTQLESTIASLTQKLDNENLPEDQQNEIKTKIYGLGDIIKDIEDDPEGDYDEDYINSVIDDYVSQYDNDINGFITEYGFDKKFIMDFVDVDEVVNTVVNSDGYGNLLSPYDGDYDEFTINGTTYYVMRTS
jgi:hypothetical protein